jgi:small conductance mechanosensitive channel
MTTHAFIKQIDELLADRGLGFVSAIIDVALTFLFAWLLVRLIRAVVRRALKARKPAADDGRAKRLDTAATLTVSIAKYAIYFLAAAAAIGQLGLTASMTSLLTAAGIGGVVVGIGAQSLVKDIVSGFFMLFEDQFSVGDYITAAGVTGTVTAIALRTTTIRSYTGELTIIPNGSIATLTNYSRTNTLALVDMPISYGEDSKKALSLMEEEARAYRGEIGDRAVSDPEIVGAAKAENGMMMLRVAMLVKPLEHWSVQRELTARIAARFAKEGIRLPYSSISVVNGEAQRHG